MRNHAILNAGNKEQRGNAKVCFFRISNRVKLFQLCCFKIAQLLFFIFIYEYFFWTSLHIIVFKSCFLTVFEMLCQRQDIKKNICIEMFNIKSQIIKGNFLQCILSIYIVYIYSVHVFWMIQCKT